MENLNLDENLLNDALEETTNEQTNTEEKAETSKDIWLRMFYSIKHLTQTTKDNIVNYLEQTDFFTAPASTKYHNNCEEGLCRHSINVAETLMTLTKNNNLVWEHEDSPILIGLLHDICKIGCYDVTEKNVLLGVDPKTKKNIWGKGKSFIFNDKNPLLGNHGDRSVNYLLMLRTHPNDFTITELACIRWHMGHTQEGEEMAFNNVIKQLPLAYWTHFADNLASLNEPIYK